MTPLKHRSERRAIGRLFIELNRVMARAVGGRTDSGLLLVASAVVVGHAEGAPMSALKIAHYVELPRTTVLRKLEALEALGMIERRGTTYVITREHAINTGVFTEGLRLIRAAERELQGMSKSDTPRLYTPQAGD
jgi:hypothetical protein